MAILLTVIFVISAILLAALVLLQDEQGEGIGGMFGGGSGTPFGSRAGNILTRATAVLATIFLLSAFGVAWLNRSAASDDVEARARARQREEAGASSWYAPVTPAEEPQIPQTAESAENAEKQSPAGAASEDVKAPSGAAPSGGAGGR